MPHTAAPRHGNTARLRDNACLEAVTQSLAGGGGARGAPPAPLRWERRDNVDNGVRSPAVRPGQRQWRAVKRRRNLILQSGCVFGGLCKFYYGTTCASGSGWISAWKRFRDGRVHREQPRMWAKPNRHRPPVFRFRGRCRGLSVSQVC